METAKPISGERLSFWTRVGFTIGDFGITDKPRIISVIIGLNVFAAIAIVLYGIAFSTVPEAIQTRPGDPVYVAFEQAFPLADAWLVVAATLGAIGLRRMRDWGLLPL